MHVRLETIEAPKNQKRKKRVGRGNGSGHGTTATRGFKGQRARSGGKSGIRRRAFKAALQKMPKLRGTGGQRAKKATVTLGMLNRVVQDGETINPHMLETRGLIATAKHGVKIVATGTLNKKVSFEGIVATKKAIDLIEKVGGKLTF